MNDRLKRYEYYPKDPKKLKLKEVLHKLRDYRLLFIFSIPVCLIWGCFAAACIAMPFIYEFKTEKDYTDMIMSYIVLAVSALAIFVIYPIIFAVKKSTTSRAAVTNTKKYLQIPDSFTEDVENDLAKGMPFLKSHNLGISENYIFGNLTLVNFTPVIIPRSEIVEVVYEIFEGNSALVAHNGHVTNARNFYQNFFFRLKNGNYVPVQVNDKFKLDIALAAIQQAGLKTIELNRNAAGNALRSKATGNRYTMEPERIIVRILDVTKIIPLPINDGCIRFEEISFGSDGNLYVTALCRDDGKIRYLIDERKVAITSKQVIVPPQPQAKPAEKKEEKNDDLPVWVQDILKKGKMLTIDFFMIMNTLDWKHEGDNEKVLKPLIAYLAYYGDNMIFAFDDKMAELLYSLDTYEIASKCMEDPSSFSSDEFLYTRCVALINGRPYYNSILKGKKNLPKDMDYEDLLYVPMKAWAKAHNESTDKYPHRTPISYETFSNKEGWKDCPWK